MAQGRKTGPVRGSKTGRPIMVALDLLGKRWSLRVLWELRAGPHTFRSLQTACEDVSPGVLNTRLKELREAGLIDRSEAGYVLTPIGAQLGEAIGPLDTWSQKWIKQLGGG
ncbi:MAG: helix-turn-helix domain-containing protein [Myxococcota bacterium]